jgi:hypothetical protein
METLIRFDLEAIEGLITTHNANVKQTPIEQAIKKEHVQPFQGKAGNHQKNGDNYKQTTGGKSFPKKVTTSCEENLNEWVFHSSKDTSNEPSEIQKNQFKEFWRKMLSEIDFSGIKDGKLNAGFHLHKSLMKYNKNYTPSPECMPYHPDLVDANKTAWLEGFFKSLGYNAKTEPDASNASKKVLYIYKKTNI